MTDKIALLLEAERRGILPPDKAPLLAEARKRGLVGGSNQTSKPSFAGVTGGSGSTEATPANDSRFAQMISGGGQPAQHGDYPSVLGPEFEKRAGGGIGGRIAYSASQVMPSLFKGDEGVRNRALEAVPGSRMERTEDGAEVVVTPEGQRFYVNKPGLDVDDAFRFGGQVASFLPAGRLVRGTMGAKAVQAGVGAAATDAAGQTLSGQGVDTQQVGLSGLLGMGGQLASDGIVASGKAAAAKVTPELRALYERAKAAGINLTPAQLSNSEFVKRVATQLGKLPLAGGRQVAERQQAAGNREVARLIGENADSVTPQVLNNAATQIGKKFDTVFAGGMRYDRQFLGELAALRQEAAGLDDTAKNALEALVKRVRTQAKNGTFTGHTLQSIDQQARRWASGGGDRQHVAEAFRESLHETFGRQAPSGVKKTWDEARRQWATLKTIEPVVARNTEGGVPLAQLQGAVTATKAGSTARARGRDGDLGLLASIGQRTKAPNSSGTAENMLASQAFNPLAWGPLALASMGGLATRGTINNAGLAPLLMRQGRGQTRQLIAPYARPLPPAAAQYLPGYAPEMESDPRFP